MCIGCGVGDTIHGLCPGVSLQVVEVLLGRLRFKLPIEILSLLRIFLLWTVFLLRVIFLLGVVLLLGIILLGIILLGIIRIVVKGR